MESDTQAPSRRTNFLLRQVVVASPLMVCLLSVWGSCLIYVLVANFLLFVVLLCGNLLVIAPLVRRASVASGRATDAEEVAEVKAATSGMEAVDIRWRQIRTFQMWYLAVLLVLSVGLVLDDLGIINF